MEILPFQAWGLNLPLEKPLLISGPCSAETEEQVMATALRIRPQGIHLLRAGIWKPRTRPDTFEGVGKVGLPWLVAAGKAAGLPVCTEVAKAAHVEEALKAGVDVLWIGARSTVNPFTVQEIADALRGVDVPVMIKNPVNPDLELWIGAFERLSKAGIQKMLAIHRGFSFYKSPDYRNIPNWEVPLELKRRMPQIQIICDPSHICGRRDTLLHVAQKAYDLNLDGLMLESHIAPDEAWSDAEQQITPEELGLLLAKLTLPQEAVNNPLLLSRLDGLRKMIDDLDRRMVEVIGQRMELARQIGVFKKENNVSIFQLERWIEVFATRTAAGIQQELSDEFMNDLLNAIHKESIRHQELMLGN